MVSYDLRLFAYKNETFFACFDRVLSDWRKHFALKKINIERAQWPYATPMHN